MAKLQLFTYFRSSASYRVRLGMAILGVSYEPTFIHLLNNGGEQKSQAYRDLNPSAQVPTLVDGDFVLGQSLPILLYLEKKYGPKLLVPDLQLQMLQLQFCEIINCTQPLQNLSTLEYLKSSLQATEEQKAAWLKKWIQNGFSACEQLLTKHPELNTPEPQIMDCFLIPQAYAAQRFGVDVTGYHCLNQRLAQFTDRAELLATHPHHQPDTPPELRS